MSEDPRDEMSVSRSGTDTAGAEPAGNQPEPAGAALPPPIQEHLAQQLRATYQVMAEKPAYLGDPALPPYFTHQIEKLEARERSQIREKAHNLGVEAVEAALQEVASGAVRPEELLKPPAPRRRLR